MMVSVGTRRTNCQPDLPFIGSRPSTLTKQCPLNIRGSGKSSRKTYCDCEVLQRLILLALSKVILVSSSTHPFFP